MPHGHEVVTTSAPEPGPALVSPDSAPGPWRTAWAQFRHNWSAMAAGGVVLLITISALTAPLFARYVAHTDPFKSNINGHTVIDGVSVPVMQQSSQGLGLGVTPIGPTWHLSHYFLGADGQG